MTAEPMPSEPRYVIIAVGWVSPLPCPVVGSYLEWYDPRADAWGGEQVCGWTRNPFKAMTFPNAAMAMQKWREPLVDEHNVPRQRADRPGAHPAATGTDKPLTAYHITVERLTFKDGEVVTL